MPAPISLLDSSFLAKDIMIRIFPPSSIHSGSLNHILIRDKNHDKKFLLEIYGTNDQRRMIISYGEWSTGYQQKEYSKEGSMSRLAKEYPQYFEWLLFHPEIFEGKYIPDGTEIEIA